MATKKYRFVAHEIDGVEQAYPQEVDFPTSDMLLGVRGLITLPTTQATVAGTLTLTATSDMVQYFTGATAGQIVQLPNATTLIPGHRYEFYNQSSQPITVQDGSGATLFTVSQTSIAYIILQTNGTAAGGWIAWQVFVSSQASGILNYQLISTTAFSTGSTSDVLITGFTLTPSAGTYAVWFNGSSYLTTTPKKHWWSIYKGGTQIADSERAQDTAHSNQTMMDSTQTVAAFDGTQACDVRIRTTNGTLTMNARSLLLIRMGS